MSYKISRTLRASALAGLLALVSACAASASAGQTTSGGSSSGPVLNFGDQQQEFQTLLQASGALKGASYQVNFVEFDSGPLVDAGFAAHRIDVGFMGDLPATLAAKAKLPVVAAGVYDPIGADEFLLAKPGITSISQLRGKPVAYTTGTAEQAFALRALKTAGLSQQDVKQVNVSLLQLGTVLQSGAADASVVSAEQKVDYQQTHPGAKVLANQDTVQPPSYDYLLATKTALASKTKLADIDNLTERLIKAENWEKTHQSQWVTDYYVNVEHQTPALAKLILAAGGTANFVPITASVQAALQNVVTLLAGAKAIPASYSVAPLFSAAESSRYNATVKETPQHG
ncbi:MAG TPA: ABC transporter substrate-binding protein [Streptosporangiaceae bacterium]|jgi:sulfonate transport system substrate-binding protein|nr:ABC transporter substrate-binding protein [Streptosporangiaceae bacterium]